MQRIDGIDKTYPSLIKVAPPINFIEATVFEGVRRVSRSADTAGRRRPVAKPTQTTIVANRVKHLILPARNRPITIINHREEERRIRS